MDIEWQFLELSEVALCAWECGGSCLASWAAPEPPEGWPPFLAQGEEGLVSKKSLLGPQPLPQMVPP